MIILMHSFNLFYYWARNNNTHRWTEGTRSDIPSRTENQEISQWDTGLLGFRCQNAEDRRVNMILGDTSNVGKFLQRIFIGDVANEW